MALCEVLLHFTSFTFYKSLAIVSARLLLLYWLRELDLNQRPSGYEEYTRNTIHSQCTKKSRKIATFPVLQKSAPLMPPALEEVSGVSFGVKICYIRMKISIYFYDSF